MSQVKGDGKRWSLRAMVEVEWIDACVRGRWDGREGYEREAKTIVCRSSGYLLKNNKSEVALMQSISEDGSMADSMTIPRACVKKIRRLKHA